MAAAQQHRIAGERDLAEYVMHLNPRVRVDLHDDAWKLGESIATVQIQKYTRMGRIKQASEIKRDPICRGHWLKCKVEVLLKNSIHPFVFAAPIRKLLIEGRGKGRNILIIGEADCAKTFMLNPITKIFT